MRKSEFKIELKPIETLQAAAYNPRKFDEKRFALIKESLQHLGWLIPAYASGDQLLSGHQRIRAWKELGGTSIPVVNVKKLSEQDCRGLNILFNLATNDFQRADLKKQLDTEEDPLLAWPRTTGKKFIDPLIDIDYPCLNWKMVTIDALIKRYGLSYQDASGWQFTKSMLIKGVIIPLIISSDDKIANGVKRLFAYAKAGLKEIPVVRSMHSADYVSHMLNKISMDFDIKSTYASHMRWGSFRRLRLRRTSLGHGYSAWIKGSHFLRTEDFDHTERSNILKLRKRFGSTFIDFGAGHLHETNMLRSVGFNVIAFEPYHVTNRDEPDLSASRRLTTVFLDYIAAKTKFESVVISSVFNSVPFWEDRNKILTIVATLAPKVFICCRGTKDPQLYNAKGRTNYSENNFGYVSTLADYEENVILGEIISGAPKAQKFYELNELKQQVGKYYQNVIGFESHGNVFVSGENPKPIAKDLLIEALGFEFDLPYPNNQSLGMADQAIAAWKNRGIL